MNERGQITEYSMGNGQTSTQDYFDGFPTRFSTPGIQDLNFDWDYTSANLLQRRDDIKGLQENFTYDDLNRLKSAEVSGQMTYHFNYDGQTGDTKGNLTYKEDAGLYEHSLYKLHAQNKIFNPVNDQLPPDNISSTEQNLTFTSFKRIEKITEGNYEQTFDYWPEYQRVKSVLKNNGVPVVAKLYFGSYEKHAYGFNEAKDIHYVSGPDGICAIITKDGNRITTQYVYKDHLGSILVLSNIDGFVDIEQNFDAWGRHRNPNDWTYDNIPETIDRGFTGHEHMPEFALINMNARLYDPVVGKMISPDNLVIAPYNTQAYNRYAYCINNPLKYTDPSGDFFLTAIWSAVNWAVGFTSGFFSTGSGRFKAGFNEGNRRFINTYKITFGLFKPNPHQKGGGKQFWEVVSRFTWQSLQVTAGYFYNHFNNTLGRVEDVEYFHGATFVVGATRYGNAVSLGNYISISPIEEDRQANIEISQYGYTTMHEYGHYLQSKKAGLMYLFKYGLPSALGDANWTEYDANTRAARYFQNIDRTFTWIDDGSKYRILLNDYVKWKWFEYNLLSFIIP